jgi:hypothetical protein
VKNAINPPSPAMSGVMSILSGGCGAHPRGTRGLLSSLRGSSTC